jgi:T-complex protein 1 subunit eta
LTNLVLLHQQGNVTISNDGATIMKKLEIVHPAAKVLVDISLSQDAEVGGCQSSHPPFEWYPAFKTGVPEKSLCTITASLACLLQVGDGTTSVVLLAGEFLKAAKPFVEEGVHPQVGCTVRRHLAQCAECTAVH